MRRLRICAIVLAAVAVAMVGSAGFATTWNSASDFSITNNPSGQWAYGRIPRAVPAAQPDVSQFQLFNRAVVSAFGTALDWWDMGDTDPNINHNTTSGVYQLWGRTYQPNEVGMEGYGPWYTAIRWTAPETRPYSVTVTFRPILDAGDDADVYVARGTGPVGTYLASGFVQMALTQCFWKREIIRWRPRQPISIPCRQV